jgi:pimeloyl-ACP methyl ester carboxylesterase
MFVVGERSTHVEKQHYGEIKKLFPETSIEILANSGHWLHAEQPEQFLALVNHFMSDNKQN